MKSKSLIATLIIISLLGGMSIGKLVYSTKDTSNEEVIIQQDENKEDTPKEKDEPIKEENNLNDKEDNKIEETIEETVDLTIGLSKDYLLKYINVMEKIDKQPVYDEEYQTTYGMKILASEEFRLWDDLLNDIYKKLKEVLPEDKMNTLSKEQVKWINERDTKAEFDGLEYEGGTMQGLIVTTSKAYLTKERCLDLIKTYMN